MDTGTVDVDVAVIGAGLSGIAFARFFLDTHPTCRLLILEQDAHIGGVWSSDRVFDAFWAQSPLSMTSFSDVALRLPVDAPQAYSTFPAKYVTEYLERYVDSHVYLGETLRSRIRLKSRVDAATKATDGRWLLDGSSDKGRQAVTCGRLAVASGLTTRPSFPTQLGQCSSDSQSPRPLLLHHRDYGAHEQELLASHSRYANITVIGGGKSAADMVYAAAKAGNKNVNWVIRKTGGEGPGIFLNPSTSPPYSNAVEAAATRNATALNPSAFRPATWRGRMYHQSATGRSLLLARAEATDQRCKSYANYHARPGALPGFSDLEPRASFFWNSGPIGLVQQDDFWDTISSKVNVFQADLTGVDEQSLLLDDGRVVPSDAILCATGWDADYPFFTTQQACDLGLPHTAYCSTKCKENAEAFEHHVSEAAEHIKEEYPLLAYTPSKLQKSRNSAVVPGKLHRGIASLTDASVLFLGRVHLANNFRGSEAQAIWATAYWDGRLKLPSDARDVAKDIAHHVAFSRLRYPTRGEDGVNVHGDLIWYTDTLASEAGLQSHRKAWWLDWDKPCLASDFRDCKDEYLSLSRP